MWSEKGLSSNVFIEDTFSIQHFHSLLSMKLFVPVNRFRLNAPSCGAFRFDRFDAESNCARRKGKALPHACTRYMVAKDNRKGSKR